MARETQTTRALRDHAANLKAPSRRALRYLRGIVDGRPYTTLPVSSADLQELEELREMGLWPPQTCNGSRKARRKEREALDVCGISQMEEKAVNRVVQGLQGRQPELRLDYEDTSVIGRNRHRALLAKGSAFNNRQEISGSRCLHTDAKAEARRMHTSADLMNPSILLSQLTNASPEPPKPKPRKNNWQHKLATAGRLRANAERNDASLFTQRLHARPLTTVIDDENRNLEHRFSELLQRPSARSLKESSPSLGREMAKLMKAGKFGLATQKFRSKMSSRPDDLSMDGVTKCMDAHRRLGRIATAEATMERYKTGYKPTEEAMVVMLRLLLDRCKVDAAIQFVRMAHETATGFGILLTKTLLEGLRQIGVEFGTLSKVFHLVEELLPASQSVHYTIFIRGCVDNQRSDLAAEWLLKMQAAGHTPDDATYNSILAATAKHGTWENVQVTMELCQQKEIKISSEAMNAVLNAASNRPEYSLEELRELTKSIGAEWNIATWNIILKATIAKCPPDEDLEKSLKSLLQQMRDSGFSPNSVTINTLLAKIDHTGDKNPQALRRLIHTISSGESHRNLQIQDIVAGSMLSNTSSKSTAKVIRRDVDNPHSQDTTLRMVALLRELKPVEALRIFQAHIAQSLRPTTELLILGIKAVFLLPATPDIPATASIAEKEQIKYTHEKQRSQTINQILSLSATHGLDVHTSLSKRAWTYLSAVYGYKITKDPTKTNPVLLRAPSEQILFEIYKFYQQHDLKNPHHPLMVSISIQYNIRQYQTIVDLMRAVAYSEWGKANKFNIVALTILLKAYISLRDERGVKWIVEHIKERGVEPDDVFMKTLKGGIKVPMAKYVQEWDEAEQGVVQDCIKLCERLRDSQMEKREKNRKMIEDLLLDNSGKSIEDKKSKVNDVAAAV
ncbi:hypothetical protein H072_355 [Dactylellina haptotyla CBS 200.50]|uniref:Pentacotripeptide-repeat region of PRORP domain-containing protein n=1 Tax=Dactylellina haptotyla (strain CBS 200.50) TaxID=1284197 RepID=S8C1M6_DACHA|nr:hypothetical protein H072_355 [Dactylellina haptotyla CBS 200.50]